MATIGSDFSVSPINSDVNNLFAAGDKISADVGSTVVTPVNDTTDKTKTALTPSTTAASQTVADTSTTDKSGAATPETYSFSDTAKVATTPLGTLETENGTSQVNVGTATTGTASSGTVAGATDADTKTLKSSLATVDSMTGKTATDQATRVKNVAEARSKLSGTKLAEFDAKLKELGAPFNLNFGVKSLVSNATLTTSQQAVHDAMNDDFNGTKKAAKTTPAASTPAEEAKPAKKAASVQGKTPQKFSDATSEELRVLNGLPNYMIDAKLVDGNSNQDGNKVTKAGLSKVLSPQAAAELNAYVFKGKEFTSATEARDQIRAAYQGDQALRR